MPPAGKEPTRSAVELWRPIAIALASILVTMISTLAIYGRGIDADEAKQIVLENSPYVHDRKAIQDHITSIGNGTIHETSDDKLERIEHTVERLQAPIVVRLDRIERDIQTILHRTDQYREPQP